MLVMTYLRWFEHRSVWAVGIQPGCYRTIRPYATARSLSLCTPSSATLSRAMISSAQVADRYVGGPTRNLIRCPGCWRRIVRQNSTASLDLWRTSSSTKSKKSGTQSNSASVTLLAVHANSAASQHAGAQLLHRVVAIDDEHVFRAHWKGNRRLRGHKTPPSLLQAGVSESRVTFEKRASPERSSPRFLFVFVVSRGADSGRP